MTAYVFATHGSRIAEPVRAMSLLLCVTSVRRRVRAVAAAREPDAGPPQRREEFHHAFGGPGQRLELVGGHDDRHRLAVSRDGLRPLLPGEFDNLAELVLCVLERPRFHGGNVPAKFWPVKPESNNHLIPFGRTVPIESDDCRSASNSLGFELMNEPCPPHSMSRRAALSLVVVATAGALVGCDKGPPAADKKGGRLFAVSFQTMNNPFFVDLNDGLKQVIVAHGDRLVTLDARFDSLKQRNDISDVLQQQPAMIFLNPVNWEGVRGTLLDAQRKKVPIIVVDTPVSADELVLCQVASDNVAAGRLAGEALGKLKPAAKVVILHQSINKACIDRVAGFKEAMAEFPAMKLLDTQEGKGTAETARPVMRDLLGRFPECDAAFPINDPSALGCISAIESAGKAGQITVVAVDGSREALAAIKAGKLLGSSAQFPKELGRIAAEKAYEHLAGKPVEKEVKIPVKFISAENVDEFPKGQ